MSERIPPQAQADLVEALNDYTESLNRMQAQVLMVARSEEHPLWRAWRETLEAHTRYMEAVTTAVLHVRGAE